MLRKMRRGFITAAVIAFSAVIIVLSLAVNIWNYHIVTKQQDEILSELMERYGVESKTGGREVFDTPGIFGSFSPEIQYTTRFFTVRTGENGNIISVGRDYIASVSLEEAVEYARTVMERSGNSGYYGNYRYLVSANEMGTTVIFLNAEKELQSLKALLLVTIAADAASVFAVFLLILLISKHAIAPYIRNLEAQKRFITDASHELKTPLTSIMASADILAMENSEDEWVENIRSQSAKLSKLIVNLVTLSRLNEEQPFPDRSDFSLSEAAWETAEPFETLARAKGKSYSQRIDDDIIVRGDRNAIQQMISILLDNAVKYSDENGSIALSVRKKQKKAIISVSNTCDGVNSEELPRLFDRFYRPDSSRNAKTGGTGIGLSIAKATAEAHSGTISVRSADGKSVEFTVTLPNAE